MPINKIINRRLTEAEAHITQEDCASAAAGGFIQRCQPDHRAQETVQVAVHRVPVTDPDPVLPVFDGDYMRERARTFDRRNHWLSQ